MAQEMSFAQALTEARQIIVQQSARIKSDLEKIKALQDTVAAQTIAAAERDRTVRAQADEISKHEAQHITLSSQLTEARKALEQAEAINDRQGQRLTQMQATVADIERKLSEQVHRADSLSQEIAGLRSQVPTQEDEEALAALSSLLSTKKASPAVSQKTAVQSMRIATERRAQAA